MISKKTNWPVTILLILGAIFIILPLYLTVTIAFKTPQELAGNLLALPQSWSFDNFAKAIEMTNFFNALKNSVFVTVLVVIFTVLTNSMVAYAIARNMHKKFYKFTFYYFVSAMFIPFPIIMLPIVRQTALWGMDNLVGLVILYIVYNLSFNIFIYVGYIRSIPKELEEAAMLDGANPWQTFWKIIVPNSKPVFATAAILTFVTHWSDFMWPLIVATDESIRTVQVGVQYLFADNNIEYGQIMAALSLTTIPVILIFLFFQRYYVQGITSSGVKG